MTDTTDLAAVLRALITAPDAPRHCHTEPPQWDGGGPCAYCTALAHAATAIGEIVTPDVLTAEPAAVEPPADRRERWEARFRGYDAYDYPALATIGMAVADEERAMLPEPADRAAVTPPPALTEEGRLRAQVEVLQQDAERDRGLIKVGARCMREGHQGLIESGRAVIEGHRFALSVALGLGTGAPWDAIHERAGELRRMADETPAANRAAYRLAADAVRDTIAPDDWDADAISIWNTATNIAEHRLRRMAAEAQPRRRCAHTDVAYGQCVRFLDDHDGECDHEHQPSAADASQDGARPSV